MTATTSVVGRRKNYQLQRIRQQIKTLNQCKTKFLVVIRPYPSCKLRIRLEIQNVDLFGCRRTDMPRVRLAAPHKLYSGTMDAALAAISLPTSALTLAIVSSSGTSAGLASAGAAAAGSLAAAKGRVDQRVIGASIVCGALCVGLALSKTDPLLLTLGVAFASAAASFGCSRRVTSWHGLGIGLAEQLVLVQATVVALVCGVQSLVRTRNATTTAPSAETAAVAMLCAGVAVAVLAFSPLVRSRQGQAGEQAGAAAQQAVLLLALGVLALDYVALLYVLPQEPIVWVLRLIFANMRWFVWLLVCTAGAVGAARALESFVGSQAVQRGWTLPRRQLVARKAFHVVALLLFAPPIVLGGAGGLAFMQVASAGALLLCVVLELVRASSPSSSPLRVAIDALVAPLIDERDAGPLIMTHLYLIGGCGLPLWLTSADELAAESARVGPWAAVLPLAGVLAAIGDGAAATAGVAATAMGQGKPWLRPLKRKMLAAADTGPQRADSEGKRGTSVGGAGAAPEAASQTESGAAQAACATLSCSFTSQLLWLGADGPALQRTLERKTVQGSVGFAVAAALLSWLIAAFGSSFATRSAPAAGEGSSGLASAVGPAVATALVAVLASALETCTVGVDNLVMPLAYWLLLRLLL